MCFGEGCESCEAFKFGVEGGWSKGEGYYFVRDGVRVLFEVGVSFTGKGVALFAGWFVLGWHGDSLCVEWGECMFLCGIV